MDVIQFNLMHPNLTNVFNPLANAIQEFRRDNPVKGTAIIDSIIETLFPDNGEIWNPAAGNMFRRAVYMLFDYYIEQEKYIRYIGHRDNIPQEIIDQEIDKNYAKVTLFNVYTLIGELASKISKDLDFINVDKTPNAPKASEKDLLTLMFDAMALLPNNTLRSKAITANNSIKQVATAQQTIACIYATLLTGLSVYADDTAIALMSGSLSESFDITGLGFPRRFGVNFDADYVKKFRISKELCKWTVYRDKDFTDKYQGSDFEHEESFSSSNWTWAFFKGIFDQEVVYPKLEIYAGKTVAKTFYFKFTKGYKTFDNISYIINPITNDKIISNGVMTELDPITKEPKVSTFQTSQIDYITKSYNQVNKPIITANQVYYSERPKFIFAITPPHLQVYQKHILVIIKQILDEQYANSYVVKSDRKPIVGTRLMLEEFGNIRSGENGIPNIDTVASIALGQDVQITFVLQSFQQLRSIYGEAVESIIRANSSNTIYLKSDDEELINDLVRKSGVRHEFRVKGKSVSQKKGDIISPSEPVINYNGDLSETTAITANELLFLAAKAPGNSVTFSSGEMPIVNKLSTITPMAAGLHTHLPQANYNPEKDATVPYSDSTMPSTNSNDAVNFLDNLIDGEALVRARVKQAEIAQEIKNEILDIAKANNIVINETNGELSNLMMNIVYEQYEKDAGESRSNLAEPTPYHEIATQMSNAVLSLKNKSLSDEVRTQAAHTLRDNLVRCLLDKKLSEITAIYKDSQDSSSILGFDPVAVSKFVAKMRREYPAPSNLTVEIQDVYAEASNYNEGYAKQHGLTRYSAYVDESDVAFDILNVAHCEALEDIVISIIDSARSDIPGLVITPTNKGGEDIYTVIVGTTHVADCIMREDSDDYMFEWSDDRKAVSTSVGANNELLRVIKSHLLDK